MITQLVPVFDARAVRLIAITDSLRDGVDGLTNRVASAVRGGATMIQVRLKGEEARALLDVTRALLAAVPHTPILLNDRLDVALAAGAHGVHLGVDDVSPSAARRIVPPGFIIGASVGHAAEVPRSRDADYVGIGPVHSTGSKGDAGDAIGVEGFARLAARCARPAVAIGGMTPGNTPAVIGAGAAGVAVISAIFADADPATAARALRRAVDASGS